MSTFVGETSSQLVFVMKILFALAHFVDASWELKRCHALYRLRAFVPDLSGGRQTLLTVHIQYHFGRTSACHVVCADATLNVRTFLVFRARLIVLYKRDYTQEKLNTKIKLIVNYNTILILASAFAKSQKESREKRVLRIIKI